MSRAVRDAVLDLAPHAPFAKAHVNSVRLSLPSVYDGSPLNGDDDMLPARTRPGAPIADAPTGNGWREIGLDAADKHERPDGRLCHRPFATSLPKLTGTGAFPPAPVTGRAGRSPLMGRRRLHPSGKHSLSSRVRLGHRPQSALRPVAGTPFYLSRSSTLPACAFAMLSIDIAACIKMFWRSSLAISAA